MDRPSNKRGSSGLVTKGDQNDQFCNRIGCSGRIKYNQNMKIGNSDKSKCTNPSSPSSSRNEMTKKPSRSSSFLTSTKRLYPDSTRKVSSQLKFDSSESSLSTESDRSPTGYQSESTTLETSVEGSGSSSASTNVRPSGSSVPAASRSSVPAAARSSALRSLNKNNNGSTSGLRNNLKCNLVSDVVRSRCSSLEPESVGKNKKRSSEAESSLSHRGRKFASASAYVSSPSTSGINNRASRTRLSGPQNGRNSSSIREIERPLNVGGSRSFPRVNGDDRSSRTHFSDTEPGFTHSMNQDILRRYDMDGIAEVLLALERIEQDEELTHEQFLALETSLFLSGLNLYDQHRDMRLDIDNMSYEELLALEERMGTVSTALSDEALSKCLSTTIYQPTPSKVQTTDSDEDVDDNKCSICQEEYDIGDVLGKLVECQHGYHVQCIDQWLRLKNWCPICKASLAPAQPSSSSL